jgi:hypothetical protein
MADKSYRNVILLDNYRGQGPRGSEVFSQGCVRPPIPIQENSPNPELIELIGRTAEALL